MSTIEVLAVEQVDSIKGELTLRCCYGGTLSTSPEGRAYKVTQCVSLRCQVHSLVLVSVNCCDFGTSVWGQGPGPCIPGAGSGGYLLYVLVLELVLI